MSTQSGPLQAPSLTLHTQTFPEVTIVKCQGRLIAENSAFAKDEVRRLFALKKPVVLDLSDLTRMDSSGLGAVVALYISSKSAGCEFGLVNLSKQVRELLGLTNLLSVFEACGQHGIRMP
jgi:anti-anti-sigma factor